MKAPTKAELRAQIEALTRENIALLDQLEAEQRERWDMNRNKAFSMFYRIVPFLPKDVYGLNIEHIDKSGYWFTFVLNGESKRQTFCVRHTDLQREM